MSAAVPILHLTIKAAVPAELGGKVGLLPGFRAAASLQVLRCLQDTWPQLVWQLEHHDAGQTSAPQQEDGQPRPPGTLLPGGAIQGARPGERIVSGTVGLRPDQLEQARSPWVGACARLCRRP